MILGGIQAGLKRFGAGFIEGRGVAGAGFEPATFGL